MTSLAVQALAILGRRFLAVTLFLLAYGQPWRYWETRTFLAAFFLPQLFIVLYLLKKNPDLLARRLKGGPAAESRASQKLVITLMNLGFVVLVVFSGLDHRF